MKKVTIGIPTYNRPAQLESAILSCLKQTYKNVDVIVSDNGSLGEETKEVLRKYDSLYSNFSYKRFENSVEVYQNFRSILDSSFSEYFMFLADDDYISEEFIESMVDILDKNSDLVACYSISRHIVNDFSYIDSICPSFIGVKKDRYSKFILNGDDSVFYGLYRTSVLKKTFESSPWLWPNKETYVDTCYPMIFKVLHYGGILVVDNPRSIHYIDCTPVNVKYYVDHSVGGRLKQYFYFFFRRLNMYCYYLKFIAQKDLTLLPYLTLISSCAFLKDNLSKLKIIKK